MNQTLPASPFTWELPPAPAAAGLAATAERPSAVSVAFGLPQADDESAIPVWRIDLPAEDALARRQIEQALQQARTQQKQLQALPAQFDKLAGQAKNAAAQAKTPAATGSAASFAAAEAAGAGAAGPEAELLAALAQISAIVPEGEAKGVSFGLAERLGGGWEQANEAFQAFAGRLQRMLTHLAWVETRQEGRLIGHTVVGWSGDCDTLWEPSATPEQMELHRRSLETALQSRITLLSTFTTAVQGAVKLSVLLSTPGGVILALPTVWNYIHQVLNVLKSE